MADAIEVGVLAARSAAEAHLWMDVHGWPGPRRHRLEERGDDLVAVYEVEVEGMLRRAVFSIPEDPLVEGLGGPRPSAILDAGQLLLHADRLAAGVPADLPGLDAASRARAAARLDLAIDCVEEILKFAPPGGDVPADAFRSPEGRAALEQEPGRFRRVRLEAVLRVWRTIAARLAVR